MSGSYADEKSQVSTLLEHQFKVNYTNSTLYFLQLYSVKYLTNIYYLFIYLLQLVTKFQPKECHVSAALKVYNLTKNRNLDCICTDAYRVMLSPRPGIEGSDYINASFLPGNMTNIEIK